MRPAAVLSVLVTANTGGASAQLTRLDRQLHHTARSSESAAARMGRGLATAGKYAAIAGAGVAAASVKMAADFDKSMRNVNSIAGLPEAKFKALEKDVLDLAGPTAQAPKTLAEGLYDLVSSGFDAKESMTILQASARAATAGLTDTATSTKAVAAVLNAYRRPARDAKQVSDDLFQTVNLGVISFEDLAQNIGDVLPFASGLGVDLKQVGAAISTMTKEGLSGAEATTRLKNVLVAFTKPSEALTETLRQMGYESGQQIINQKGLQGALVAVTREVGGNQAAVAKLFPNIRALGGALALTGGNARNARKDLQGFKDDAGATNRVFAEQSKSVALQWNRLKATVSVLAIQFGSKLLPAISETLKMLSNPKLSGSEKFNRLMEKISEAFSAAIPKIADAAGRAAPKVAEAFVHGFLAADIWGKLAIGAFIASKLGLFRGGVFSTAGGRAATRFGTGFKGKMAGLGRTFKGIGYGVIGISLIQGVQGALASKGDFNQQFKAGFEQLPFGVQVEHLFGMKSTTETMIEQAQIINRVLQGKKPSEELGRRVKYSEDFLRLQREIIPELAKEGHITDQQAATLEQIAASKHDQFLSQERFTQGLATLKSGLLVSFKDIREVVSSNMALINESGFKKGSERWRESMGHNLQGAVVAIKKAMRQGYISAADGQEQIRRLLHQRLLVTGSDPFKIAKGFADSWGRASLTNDRNIEKVGRALNKMPPKAADAAASTMVRMAQSMENHGKLVKGSADRLQSALAAKGYQMGDLMARRFGKGLSGLVGVFAGLGQGISGALRDIGVKVNSFLKGMGVKASFHVAEAAGESVSDLFKGLFSFGHHQRGGEIVPGFGSGDKVKRLVPAGTFVMNREATRHYGLQRGGVAPVVLEPGERTFMPHEVRRIGLRRLQAMNEAVPRFQKGGLRDPYRMQGPAGALRSYGQGALDKGWAAGVSRVKKAAAKRRAASGASGVGGYSGPPLSFKQLGDNAWVDSHTLAVTGWLDKKFGLSMSSGYRSPAHNATIGGAPGSMHTHGSPANPGATDSVGSMGAMQSYIAYAKKHVAGLLEAMVDNYAGLGSNAHLGFFQRGGLVGGAVQRLRDGGEAGGRSPFDLPLGSKGMKGWHSLGTFDSTSYGPPWNSMQGTGVTSQGTDLRPAKPAYIVAIDPSVVSYGSKLKVHPNPFHEPRAIFLADDTGGAITGNRIDIYNWKGRGAQYGWGRRSVHVWKAMNSAALSPGGPGGGAADSSGPSEAQLRRRQQRRRAHHRIAERFAKLQGLRRVGLGGAGLDKALALARFWHYFRDLSGRDEKRWAGLEKRLDIARTPAARRMVLGQLRRAQRNWGEEEISGHAIEALRKAHGPMPGYDTPADRKALITKRTAELGKLKFNLANAVTDKGRRKALDALSDFWAKYGLFGARPKRIGDSDAGLGSRGRDWSPLAGHLQERAYANLKPKRHLEAEREWVTFANKRGRIGGMPEAEAKRRLPHLAKTKVDASERIANLKELLRLSNLRLAVSEAQGKVLAEYPAIEGALAKGGWAQKAGTYLVGERGPELAELPAGTRVRSNAETRTLAAPDVRVIVHGDVVSDRRNPIEVRVDDRQVEAVVEKAMRRTARRAGRPLPGRGGGRI